jgi:SNF2 family DNA or RNA helicase
MRQSSERRPRKMISELSLNFTPYNWQVEAFRKFVDNDLDGLALLADVGTGKTATAITILRYLNFVLHNEARVLVIGPSVVITNWKNEIKRYALDNLDPIFPLTDAKKRVATMSEVAHLGYSGVVITNYESFDNEVFCGLIAKWCPSVIVCDELHRIKSYKSKRAKNIVKLSEKSLFRLGLTGSAILNSPMDLFMQWKFIDGGRSFGTNFFNFRNKYFADANARWAGKHNYFPKWEPIPELFGQLTDKIRDNSIRVVKAECMDLPPYIEKTIKLQMSPKQKKAYEQMHRDFIAFVDNGGDRPAAVVAQLALTKALRLMQIASGFAAVEEGEGVVFPENPKLDAIEKILEDNPDAKVIIWCSYKANYTAIGERLTKLKIPHVFLTGEQDAKEKQESIDAFQNDEGTRVIVANRKAGGIGVNLTAASLSIVFSRNFSLEEEIQSDGRNYRGGSQIHASITKINLIMEGTIEEQIVEALKNKSNISEIILAYK